MAGLTLRAHAPAKLNLCLFVGPRRDDGLHEICSLFQSVTLADEVLMQVGVGERDEVVCPGVDGPNLAAFALERFREHFDWRGPPVRITIAKRIPIAAGLAGGSADAAAVLRLARLASQLPIGLEGLLALAPTIGADVPSQVEPGSHLVLGGGDIVARLPKQWHLAAVLLTTEPGLKTADVYAASDRLGTTRQSMSEIHYMVKSAVTATSYSPLGLLDEVLHNDLQRAAIELEPRAAGALQLLRDSGAHKALLTGSGPTAFGLYANRAEAEAARAELAARWPGETILVEHAPRDYAAVVRSSS